MDHRGHAAHFLTRIDRLNSQHAELALGLYRDHELLRTLLKRTRLPEGTDRVALALDDKAQGPYVIVNRDGRFITCLGQGMVVYDSPIVKRSQLDAIAQEMDVWRDLIERARQGTTEVDRYLKRVIAGRGNLSQEEFDELVRWSPLLYDQYLRLACEGALVIDRARGRLLSNKRVGPRDEPVLKAYCEAAWGQMHLWSLMAVNPKILRDAHDPPGRVLSAFDRTWFCHQLMGFTTWPGVFRGAMVAAWMGELVLPGLEEELGNVQSFQQSVHGMLAVYAALRRDPVAYASSRGALERLDTHAQEGPLGEICAEVGRAYLNELGVQITGKATEAGIDFLTRRIRETRDGTLKERFAAFPPADARASMLGDPRQFSVFSNYGEFLECLFEVCTLEPRDFYVSEAHRVYQPWTLEEGLRWFLPQLESDFVRKRKPVQRLATPGRNQSCSCGSGKKYKYCCVAAERVHSQSQSAPRGSTCQ